MAKKKPSTAIAKWDEELAKYAEAASEMEACVGGGQFFSVRGGLLSWQNSPVPDNEMAVIIVDSVLENVYYEGRFDPEVISPPSCFAFGREESSMEPHEDVVKRGMESHESCEGCPMNEWGSADTGKGKACRNTRRLALISAGTIDGDDVDLFEDEVFATAELGYLKLPVTSVKGYATYVKQIAGTLRRPPFGVLTKIKVIPDDKTQFKVVFELIDKVPDDLMATIMQRRELAEKEIMFPYSLDVEDEAPAKKAPHKKAAKKAVKKAPRKKVSRKTSRKY